MTVDTASSGKPDGTPDGSVGMITPRFRRPGPHFLPLEVFPPIIDVPSHGGWYPLTAGPHPRRRAPPEPSPCPVR